MTDPNTEPDAGRRIDAGSPPGMPRWVKVSAIIVGVLILLFVVVQLTGVAGRHGPARHLGEGPLPAASVTDGPLASASA